MEKYYSKIIDQYCEFFMLNPVDIKGKSRKKELVEARFHIMKMLKINTELSLSMIGRLFSRDHSTVIHAISTHNDLCSTDKVFLAKWMEFEKYVIKLLLEPYNFEESNNNKISLNLHNNQIEAVRSECVNNFLLLLRSYKGKNINESLIEKFEKS